MFALDATRQSKFRARQTPRRGGDISEGDSNRIDSSRLTFKILRFLDEIMRRIMTRAEPRALTIDRDYLVRVAGERELC
jgi:hypothetical protein